MKKKNSILLITVSTLFVFLQASSVLAEDIVIDQNTTWTEGNYTYDNVHITNGATLTFDGKVTLNAQNLTIDSSSSISADGKGYGPCSGPGAGETTVILIGVEWPYDRHNYGGGGGYGGNGGAGGNGATGGVPYGSVVEPNDLGSGGGTGNGGAGGGLIRLNVNGTLTVNGSISADGNNGTFYISPGWVQVINNGGGGSGGSLNITTSALTGSGSINANGGNGSDGGGGGGRIAIYYDTSTYTGSFSANGGTGSEAGEDGTVLINTQLLNAPETDANLSEKSSSQSTLIETLLSQKAILDVTVSGDMNGVINFTNFEIVSVETGSFAGKGFSKGQWQANLEGLPYTGDWKGFCFHVPSERKIYLKGVISGEISAIVEGSLTESVPESGVYDQYQATWKLSRVGTETVSGTINLSGTINYQESAEYPSTELYVLQTSVEGNTLGHYTGPLSTVLTHLRVASETNPYYGEGFSIISYESIIGQGQGWAYNTLASSNISELTGFFESPLLGIATGTLDESNSPRRLSVTLERIDLGLPPATDLKVNIWGPGRVSPGQTIDYIIEYRNDGLKAADDAIMFYTLDPSVNYISSSTGGSYDDFYGKVSWNLGQVHPKTVRCMSVQVRVAWGLPGGTELNNFAYVINIETSGMKTSAMETQDYKRNLAANGIQNSPEMYPANHKKWNLEFAPLLDADTVPGLYSSGDTGHDVRDVIDSTPSYYKVEGYDTDGCPLVKDPVAQKLVRADLFLDNYQGTIPMNGNTCAWYFKPTENNGLLYFQGNQQAVCSSVFAFSGGTRTVLTAILSGYLECDRLVLISPMTGGGRPEYWKWEIERIQQMRVERGLPKMEIVIYQSRKDLLATKFLSWLFQAKFSATDIPWLVQNNIKVNPGTAEFGFNAPLIVDVLVDGKSIKREVKIDEEINKQNHGGVFQMFNCILQGKEGTSSSSPSIITPARDPSVKYGPEGNVLPGQKLNYRVEYENEGEGIAYGVYFTDTLSKDLDDSTLEIAGPGIYNSATRTITWFAGEVGPGQGGYADVNVCVRSDANEGTEIINYATIYFPSVPEETRTNGIVSIVSLNRPPEANAGPDQTVYAWIDGRAEVTLDGSDSNDPDGDELTYSWSWVIDGNTYEANGVNPTIELPVGQYVISLTVNDGTVDSVPDNVNITVIAPLKSKLDIMPCVINRSSHQPYILAFIRLPEGIMKKDIDNNEPLTIYPGGIEASRQWIIPCGDGKHKQKLVGILAFFDKDDVLDAVPTNGQIELKVTGKLTSGQYFYGCDTVKIIGH